MSEDLTNAPFKEAADRLEQSYEQAVEDVKVKVQKAKSAAVKKVTP